MGKSISKWSHHDVLSFGKEAHVGASHWSDFRVQEAILGFIRSNEDTNDGGFPLSIYFIVELD